MRRMMLFLLGVSLVSMLAGCHCFCAHGVCDCEEEDHCSSRSPWVRGSGAMVAPTIVETTGPGAEPIPAPSKLPDAKKGL